MNNYFCVLPFFGYEFYIDGGSHCCLLPTEYDIELLRKDMKNGVRSPFCTACWKLEDQGLVSDRIIKNSTLDFYWDRDIEKIEEDAKKGITKPLMVKNVTSNTCNSTCVTCNSKSSSAWSTLDKKMGILPEQIPGPISTSRAELDKNLNYAELLAINFLGGEPLYEKLNFYILEKLLEHNNTNCFISVTTNGSIELSDYQKSMFKKFKNVGFNISIDGVGPVFEYMRYPLKWNDLLVNLEFFRTITDNISVSYTISNLNILYHHETISWFKEQNLNFNYNLVIEPEHFRPGALPKHIKEKIINKIAATENLEVFFGKDAGKHTDKDDADFAHCLEAVKAQDTAKKISIKDYLPEFCNLL